MIIDHYAASMIAHYHPLSYLYIAHLNLPILKYKILDLSVQFWVMANCNEERFQIFVVRVFQIHVVIYSRQVTFVEYEYLVKVAYCYDFEFLAFHFINLLV